MRHALLGVLTIFSFTVSGCVQAVSQKEYDNALSKHKTCVETVKRDLPSQAIVEDQLFWATGDSTREEYLKQINPERLNDQQKTDMLELWPRLTQCRVDYAKDISNLSPRHGDVLAISDAAITRLRTSLLSDKLSIGEYNAKRSQIYSRTNAELKSVSNQIDAEHRAGLRSAAQAIRGASQAFKPPKTFRCTGYGSTVNCY